MIVTLIPHAEFLPVPWVEIAMSPFEGFDGGDSDGGGDLLDGGDAGGGGILVDGGNASTLPVVFPDGTATVTVRSRVQGRTFTVRGAVDRSIVSLVVNDYEAPFGVPVMYEAVCFDAGGAELGTVELGVVTLDVRATVIQQPLDPKLNATVTELQGTAEAVERPGRAGLVDIDGRVLPAYVGGVRGGVTGVVLRMMTDSLVMADRLQATLGTYEQRQPQMWLVRTPPPIRLPRVFFCHVPVLREIDVNVMRGRENIVFEASVTEIPQPVPGVAAAVLRYSDVEALFATYSSIEAGYSTYSDIQRDSSLIGAADA